MMDITGSLARRTGYRTRDLTTGGVNYTFEMKKMHSDIRDNGTAQFDVNFLYLVLHQFRKVEIYFAFECLACDTHSFGVEDEVDGLEFMFVVAHIE